MQSLQDFKNDQRFLNELGLSASNEVDAQKALWTTIKRNV